eukprot:6108711-Prymnesium_polylepis.1
MRSNEHIRVYGHTATGAVWAVRGAASPGWGGEVRGGGARGQAAAVPIAGRRARPVARGGLS